MKIAVVGVGTVGVLSVCHWLRYTKDTQVYSIHNKNIKILGIGETTNVHFTDDIYHASGFHMAEHANELDATFKTAVKWVNWRDQDFFTHIVPPAYGIHFNNWKIHNVIFDKIKKKSPDRFFEIEGNVDHITNGKDKATVIVDGEKHDFDIVIDCMGYPKSYENYNEIDVIPVNSALVNLIHEPGDWGAYTFHQATPHGWMFGIPLQTRQGWGYLYNNKITPKEEAVDYLKSIMKDKFNPDLKEFKFKNYYANQFIDGRILKNGNKALFFEPLEAIAGVFWNHCNRAMWDVVFNGQTEQEVNDRLKLRAKSYINFIAFIYKNGSKFNSSFWEITKKKCKQHLNNSDLWRREKECIFNYKPGEEVRDPDFITFPFELDVWQDFVHKFN